VKTRNVATTALRRIGALGAATALAVTLVACGDDDDTSMETTATSALESSAEGLTFTDGYVGAKSADTAMTAVFGVLINTTDEDIHLTEVTGDLTGEYQYHEVVDGVMRETADGITVPAGDSLTLEPGGHHIMIMDSPDEIAAGDELSLTLTDDNGTTYELNGIPVRVQQSSHEDYGTDGDADSDHDMH
jgi:copper(I)-binding protein